MTKLSTSLPTLFVTALSAAVLAGCGSSEEMTITERNTVVLSDAETAEAADTEYLNSARDPEGDGLQGEPVGETPEGSDYESINENLDGNDPVETADRDADPSD